MVVVVQTERFMAGGPGFHGASDTAHKVQGASDT